MAGVVLLSQTNLRWCHHDTTHGKYGRGIVIVSQLRRCRCAEKQMWTKTGARITGRGTRNRSSLAKQSSRASCTQTAA